MKKTVKPSVEGNNESVMVKSEQSMGVSFNTWKLIILGLAFMAPGLSLLATFNLVITAGYTWMGIPLSYLIAGVAIIITSVSFAELVRVFPKSGSLWSLARGAVGSKFGQFSIWIYLLEILVVPAAALIPAGFFLQSWLGVPPWITMIVFVAVVSLLAWGGTNLSVRSMAVLFIIQVAILVAFAVSAVIWSINTGNFATQASLSLTPAGSLFGIAGIMVGATVAVYSFLGYEAPASVTEESEEPTKSVPWAIVISAVAATGLYLLLAWAFVLAIPSIGLFSLLYYVNPVPAMGNAIWGSGIGNILNFAGIIAGLVSALAAVTAASRVLQKLGADRVAPKALSRVDRKLQTPVIAIGLISVITMILANFTPWEVIAYTIATGALPAFIITNLLAFWYYRKDGFTLKNIIVHGVIPWAGIFLCAWFIIFGVPLHLKWILFIWIIIGALLVCVNYAFRPALFKSEGGSEPVERGVSRPIWGLVGIVVSIVLLIIVCSAFSVWLTFYSSGLTWWHIIPPYAGGDILAIALTILATVIFAVSTGVLIFRDRLFKRKEVESR
ncbi:MAG: APC family permease [Candidatus Odinarchaeum yellowstonii]|uniref:APC family permease n=1 Tax=Odinarchaeota yellowstonii (strain LCB_4) TaxID=1841599 RepID=A0AAF0D1Y4_ODILC|nr:MAG: APC family permease [Candidatus Odinarchaeum yellowstonii]